MPERVINSATQKAETKSPSVCGSGDILLIFDDQRPFETPRRLACGWALK